MIEKEPLLVKTDYVFKRIFGAKNNTDILAAFLQSTLDIPKDEYEKLTIADPQLQKDSADDKWGVMDLRVDLKDGKKIHVEIQLSRKPEMRERCVYYQSKMVTEQLSEGQNYSELKRVISIIITDYDFIPESEHYRHQFRFRSCGDMIEFTDVMEINVLESPKLPAEAETSNLWYWLKLIKSDNDKEALNMIANHDPSLKKAVGILKKLSADERARMIAEKEEDNRRLREASLRGAREEGHEAGLAEGEAIRQVKIARNFLSMGLPLEQISEGTGLTVEEINRLRDE
jgi:predicted transposase/invertase (TIGR01784 family)